MTEDDRKLMARLSSANAGLKLFVGICGAIVGLYGLVRGPGIATPFWLIAAVLNFIAYWRSQPSRSPAVRMVQDGTLERYVINKVGMGTESHEAVMSAGRKIVRLHLPRETDRVAFLELVTRVCPQAQNGAAPSLDAMKL